ncbi:MAG: mechanosensitive ion channel family protein [Balneolaceae bacterium]
MEKIVEYFSNIERLIMVVAVIAATIIIASVIKRVFARFINRSAKVLENDPTNYKFLQHAVVALIYIAGFSFAFWNIPMLQHIAKSALAGAGILAIAIGFASQQALGNVVSGVFIVMFKPYRINDRVSMKTDLRGVVEDINLRHTVIRNFENQRIIIPNSVMSNEVLINSNFTDDKICRLIDIGISYSSDVDLARKIITEEAVKHPNYLDNRKPEDIENGVPPVTVRVLSFGESSVNLRAWVWAADPPSGFVMSCDLHESIKKRFDAEGIVIPFPQRTISYLERKA